MYQPFSVTLKTVRVKTLDGDYKTGTGFGGSESGLVDPASVDTTEAAFSDNRVRSEVSCREFEFVEAEALEVRRVKYLSFCLMSRRS